MASMRGQSGFNLINWKRKRSIALWTALAIFFGVFMQSGSNSAFAASVIPNRMLPRTLTVNPNVTPIVSPSQEPTVSDEPASTAEVTAEPTAEPTVAPTQTPSQTPSQTPTQAPSQTATPSKTPAPKAYKLVSPKASYKKGKQKGIHYKKVKGKKVYHISSYTTDTVRISMSHSSVFRVYGGGSAKEVRKKHVTVNARGEVNCKASEKGRDVYTIIEAVSKKTKQKEYIYIVFKKQLKCNEGMKFSLYERYSQTLTFNYGKKRLSFSTSDKKKATVNKKGKVEGISHGTVTICVKVKDSQKNEIRIKVAVKKEPWIVSNKKTCYDYEDMEKDLLKLDKKYPGKAKLSNIGTTADNRTIWCIRVGKASAEHKLVIDAAIHAREWKNVQVVMRQTEEMLREYKDFKERFKNTAVYIVPMVNPDGVTISQHGFGAIKNKKLRKKCKKIGNAKIWKANARGVDLNDNFPAGFTKKGKWVKKKPSYMGYPGKKAGSEKESKALMTFINTLEPDAVLNIHSTGSIIYWDFDVEGEHHEELTRLAQKVNSFNKYTMMPKSSGTSAAGGFADWLNYKKKIVSITIETGQDVCPLDHAEYKTIYKKNNKMFRWYMTKYVAYGKDEKSDKKQDKKE